jgi:tRNA(fMet)-specific endonuclease VapC
MAYLLDTNAWVAVLRARHLTLAQRIKKSPPGDILLCSIVKAELLHGANRSTNPSGNIALVEALLIPHKSLPFDDAAAEKYGQIRSALELKGMTIGANDYLIASIALAGNLILVTNNTSEFARVPGLRMEDWQTP